MHNYRNRRYNVYIKFEQNAESNVLRHENLGFFFCKLHSLFQNIEQSVVGWKEFMFNLTFPSGDA